MPKRTIYITEKLAKAMRSCKQVNWSAVAAAAFDREIQRFKENKMSGTHHGAIIERLRATRVEEHGREYDAGFEAGKEWAAKHASAAQLKAIAAAADSDWDPVRDVVGTDLEDALGFAGAMLRNIDENEWGNRQDQGEFWKMWLDAESPTVDAVRGFCAGAASIWDDVGDEVERA